MGFWMIEFQLATGLNDRIAGVWIIELWGLNCNWLDNRTATGHWGLDDRTATGHWGITTEVWQPGRIV